MAIALVVLAAVHNVAQLLAGLEIGNPFGGNLDARSRFRISANPGLPLPRPKAAKTSDLDLVSGVKTVHNAFKDRFDDDLRILSRHLHNL